jgi:hypothetical protein
LLKITENCIRQTEDEILTSVYVSALFQTTKTRGKAGVSIFSFRKIYLKVKIIGTLLPGDLVTSDEGSPPKTFGVMAVAVLVYSARQWAGTP